MEFYLQAALLMVFGIVLTLAVRATLRVKRLACERGLQRATLLACADVMANEKNTAKSREFASLIAVFSLSDKVMTSFGRDHKLIRARLEDMHRNGELGLQHGGLSDVDKKTIQPALNVFAMSCLLRDPRSSLQVRRVWEQIIAESYARANSTSPEKAKPRVVDAVRSPIKDKIHEVEGEVIDSIADLCYA